MTKKNKNIPQYGINYKTGRGKNRRKPRYARRPANAPGGSGEVLNGCLVTIVLFVKLLIPFQ